MHPSRLRIPRSHHTGSAYDESPSPAPRARHPGRPRQHHRSLYSAPDKADSSEYAATHWSPQDAPQNAIRPAAASQPDSPECWRCLHAPPSCQDIHAVTHPQPPCPMHWCAPAQLHSNHAQSGTSPAIIPQPTDSDLYQPACARPLHDPVPSSTRNPADHATSMPLRAPARYHATAPPHRPAAARQVMH